MEFIILVFIFLFGTIIGSFLNCLIWRLHKNQGLGGRSYCPKCRKQIAWYDNIPVLSFLLLRGKCRNCKKSISWQYPVVEVVTGVLFVISFFLNFEFIILNFESIFNYKFLIFNLKDWFIISVMVIIFVYDLKWYLILDIITLPAVIIIFILNLFIGINWPGMIFAGLIGGGFFLLQFVLSKGKWIGGGDIRLGLLMGLIFGNLPLLLVALLLAYFLGSIVGVGLILAGKKKWGSKIPLGVFLSLTTVITLFWGTNILNWYLNLF